jgi:hypothetical protein
MLCKQVHPSQLVKGTEYYFSIDGKFNETVSGRYICSRIEIDGNDFNHLLFR